MDEDFDVEIIQQEYDKENQQLEPRDRHAETPAKQEEFRLKVGEEVLVQKSLQSGQLL